MPDSVYKVIELIGTSNDSWKRRPPMRSGKLQNLSEISALQSRQTRYATGCEGKRRGLSRQAQRFVQVRRFLSLSTSPHLRGRGWLTRDSHVARPVDWRL